MSATRRAAALGLLAAGLGAGHARALGPAPAEALQTEMPEADEPSAFLDTGRGRNDHMLAPVSINGQGPFSFLLDTGANISCVSNRLAAQLNLEAAEHIAVHTVVGVRQRPIVTIDHLQVGPRNRRKVRAPSLPIAGADIDGVLGVDWLKGQRLVLDFKARTMEITRSRADNGEPGRVVVVAARRRYGQLTIIDADLSGRRISAIIDSGAQSTLCNGPLREIVRKAEARKGPSQTPRMIRMETLAGETFMAETVFLPFLRLGGLHLGNVQVNYADAHVFDIWGLKDTPALVIGMDLLSQFEQVALDFGRSAVRFEYV